MPYRGAMRAGDALRPLRPLARAARRAATRVPLSAAGSLGAAGALWIATSPSLLPRTWWMWAINGAASTSCGYAVGAVGSRALRTALRTGLRALPSPSPLRARRLPRASGHLLRWGGGTALIAISTVSWLRGASRQGEISRLVGQEPKSLATPVVGTAAGLGISGALLLGVRALTATGRLYRAALRPHLPPPAVGAGSALLTAATGAIAVDLLWRGQVLARAMERAERANMLLSPGLRPPSSPLRSGGPGSTQLWETLGAAGRRIVAAGASADAIARATGAPALEPIRVYAGRRTGSSLEQTVAAMLAELDRTGAWEREVIVLFTGTGTGWLQQWSLSAIEMLTGGNCATASLQYSAWSSALNYLLDRRTPQRAGRLAFEAVRARIDALPASRRPRLLVAGESLGSFGGQAAFADAEDMLERTDGAVWTGTPGFTPIAGELTRTREHGSLQIAPVVGGGRHIRFATAPADLLRPLRPIGAPEAAPFGPWEAPRIAYVQHASDPVVWWSPRLLWEKPDWLRERAGRDVSPAVRWFPWITFWQLAADMPLSGEVGGGHGHSYHEELVAVWAGVLGLDPAIDRRAMIAAIRREGLPRG